MEMMLKMGAKTRKFTAPGEANGDCAMYQSATIRRRQHSSSPFYPHTAFISAKGWGRAYRLPSCRGSPARGCPGKPGAR